MVTIHFWATCVCSSVGAPDEVQDADHRKRSSVRHLLNFSVASVGVVYGDIGTSPLYALRESLSHSKSHGPSDESVIGTISLLWALFFVVTAKYVVFLMRADNREGGTLSLMALAQRSLGRRALSVFVLGIAGAALFSGDAVITPAISVLSAVEGLYLVTPILHPYVLPITVLISVSLFLVQKGGTARISARFPAR